MCFGSRSAGNGFPGVHLGAAFLSPHPMPAHTHRKPADSRQPTLSTPRTPPAPNTQVAYCSHVVALLEHAQCPGNQGGAARCVWHDLKHVIGHMLEGQGIPGELAPVWGTTQAALPDAYGGNKVQEHLSHQRGTRSRQAGQPCRNPSTCRASQARREDSTGTARGSSALE